MWGPTKNLGSFVLPVLTIICYKQTNIHQDMQILEFYF